MKKIIKKIAMCSIALIIGVLSIINTKSYAVTEVDTDETNLYSLGQCPRYLKHKKIAIKTEYVVYNKGGVEYPAYCLNVDLKGVGDIGPYNVTTKEKISNVNLWKVIINGYPYKTLEELGVSTKEEAYTATKQAVCCIVNGRKVEDYEANGAKGNATLQALKTILENASKETLSQVANRVTINTDDMKWEEDNIDKNYVSKTYYIKADARIGSYKITENKGLPEGTKITNLTNIEQNTFSQGEKFKVLIPISSLRNSGEISLKVETKMDTKPILYGKAVIAGVQDYALTGYSYEDAINTYSDTYNENQTKIKIIKKDKDTKEPLSNVEFAILDENKKQVYSGLVTDKNGEIIIKNVIPGKYYIQEIHTLEGYEISQELIEIKVEFNQELTVTVNNLKEEVKTPKENITKENIEVTPQIVKKLPVTGM